MEKLFEFNESNIAKLSFDRELCSYLYYSETSGINLGKIFLVSQDVFFKICKILEGTEDYDIKPKDRVYIMPGNSMPLNRLKTYIKSKKAYVTTEIEKATVFLSGGKIIDDIDNHNYQNSLNCLLLKLHEIGGMLYNNRPDDFENFYENSLKGMLINRDLEIIKEDYNEKDISIYLSKRSIIEKFGWNAYIEDSKSDYAMYPITLDILYHALSKKIPIISQEYLNDNAHSKLDLSIEENYQNINMMLDSNDRDNREMGRELLYHSNFQNAHLNLYRLAQDHYHTIQNSRSKNCKYFLEASDMYNLSNTDVCTFISGLYHAKKLNKETLNKLLNNLFKYANEYGREDSEVELVFEPIDDYINGISGLKLKEEYLNILKENNNEKKNSNQGVDSKCKI